MTWEFFVSARYLLSKQKEKFISVTSLISILGVAVGVCALIVVIGVMNGFDRALQDKIMGMNAHMVVISDKPLTDIKLPHVEAAANFVSGQAIITSGKETQGILLRGIDPASEKNVTKIGEYLRAGMLPMDDESVLIGSELAERLLPGSIYYPGGDLRAGGRIKIFSLGSNKPLEFKVCGVFTSGMYEYDSNLVITSIKGAQQILGMGEAISGISLKIDDPMNAGRIKKEIQLNLGYPYWVRSWMDMNRNLFSALKLEKITMFIILTLIILVACFNIASSLIMMVIEKTKDIGILKAIGASRAGIVKIFILQGFLIGAAGTVIGGALGLWLGAALGRYPIIEKLGLQDIYYFDRLPVLITPSDFFTVTGVAVAISLIATIYPALKAAGLSPVEALRYE